MATESGVQGMETSGARQGVAVAAVPANPRISWGAIFGGAVTALALWMLLYTLGLALGLSTVEPDDPGSVKSSGLFTGIWSAVTPLIALFVGGLVASHSAGVLERKSGAIHGLVVWGLTLLLGAGLVFSLLGNVVGGLASVGKSAVQAGGEALSGLAGQADGTAQAFGLDANDALAPVNQRLQAEGKPAVTPQQLQTATRDVVQQAVRTGRVDRATLVQSLSQNTALSGRDAEEVATRIETQINQARSRAGELADRAQTGALKAADATGKAFWGMFFALLLGMVAAVGGSLVGIRQRLKDWESGQSVARSPVLRERPGHA